MHRHTHRKAIPQWQNHKHLAKSRNNSSFCTTWLQWRNRRSSTSTNPPQLSSHRTNRNKWNANSTCSWEAWSASNKAACFPTTDSARKWCGQMRWSSNAARSEEGGGEALRNKKMLLCKEKRKVKSWLSWLPCSSKCNPWNKNIFPPICFDLYIYFLIFCDSYLYRPLVIAFFIVIIRIWLL
jgi:hypothetical protein